MFDGPLGVALGLNKMFGGPSGDAGGRSIFDADKAREATQEATRPQVAATQPAPSTPAGQTQAAVAPSGNFPTLRKILASGRSADSIDKLDTGFATSLDKMIAEAPPDVAKGLTINSGYRSTERQAQIYAETVKKRGAAEAGKWAAPPGRSFHNHGQAVDLGFTSPVARQWVHDNAGKYGLGFPMAHEPWHIEPIGARGGGATSDLVDRNIAVDGTTGLVDRRNAQGAMGDLVDRNVTINKTTGLVDRRNAQGAMINLVERHPSAGGDDYYAMLRKIESGGNDSARNPSGASGRYQFLPSTWKKYGGGADIMDVAAQEAAVRRLTADNAGILSKALGRQPTNGELYLAHQQGAGGALKLLQNPDKTPTELGMAGVVRANGGDADAPSSNFIGKWTSRFGGAPASAPPADKPVEVAQKAGATADDKPARSSIGDTLAQVGDSLAESSSKAASPGASRGIVPVTMEKPATPMDKIASAGPQLSTGNWSALRGVLEGIEDA